MRTLYEHPLSGNCHKIRLLLSILDLTHEKTFVDVLNHANTTVEFTLLNPLQQIPVLVEDAYVVQDSQAILVYLAEKYGPRWNGDDAYERARVMEWLSFSANEIGNSLQPARLHYVFGEATDIGRATRLGMRALRLIDDRLATREWLALDRPTIADLACFPYVALAREGRMPLDDFSHILSWIDRIVALPGYVAMSGLPVRPLAIHT